MSVDDFVEDLLAQQEEQLSELGAEALTLAERGYYVFPCKPGKKDPLTRHGFKDATRDPAQIRAWWKEWPNANIGVDLGRSGAVVVDADPKHGANPAEVAATLGLGDLTTCTGIAPARSAQLPDSLEGVRGGHWPYRGDLKTYPKTAIPGVEIRGLGAYVVAPGSLHPSGVRYEGTYPPVSELPPVPESVLEILPRQSDPAAGNGHKLAELLAEPPAEGDRNDWLARVGGGLARKHREWSECEAAFWAANESMDHPLTAEEVKATGLKSLRGWWEAAREDERREAEGPSAQTTWAPVPLDDILDGDYAPPAPTMLARTDGPCLLYSERSHTVSAEPEALKTWLALGACAERLAVGETVLFIDFEDSAPGIVGRLRALGVAPAVIRERFIYIRPDEALTAQAIADLDSALKAEPTLAIIDGITEAFARQGLNPYDNGDVATWLDLLPRRLTRAGVATLQLDHVVKDREARGRYAIGAQHKLAGVDIAYSMHVVEPFGRGRSGVVTIKVQKDRPGGIREHAVDSHIATLRATSHDDGRVSLALDPPSSSGSGAWRPTRHMENISRWLDGHPGASKVAVEEAVTGRAVELRRALNYLVDDGYVDRDTGGSAHRHTNRKPYREPDESPTSSARPAWSQGRPDDPSEPWSARPSPLRGGRGTGTNPQLNLDGQLVPSQTDAPEPQRGA